MARSLDIMVLDIVLNSSNCTLLNPRSMLHPDPPRTTLQCNLIYSIPTTVMLMAHATQDPI